MTPNLRELLRRPVVVAPTPKATVSSMNPRLYQLVRQDRHVHERRFEIDFEGPGAQAYVFTFG